MGLSANNLYASDVTAVPVKVRYSSSISDLTGSGVVITRCESSSIQYPVSNGSITQDAINFIAIRHLYYSRFTNDSFPNSSSMYDNWLQSTAASGTLAADVRSYPDYFAGVVMVAAIPRDLYGENITRYSVVISSSLSAGYIVDDGNGNLVDIVSSSALVDFYKDNYFTNPKNYFNLIPTKTITGSHVGNVIYSQGMIVVSTPNYEDVFYIPTLHKINLYSEYTIYENTVRCRVAENDFNYTLNPSANKAGFTGSYIDAVTGSNFRPYATTIGLYNQQNELLVVGKFSTPVPIPSNTDATFVVRWDS